MIGIDCVDLDRFKRTLHRSPALADRFFTRAEVAYCKRSGNFELRLASTFAAKEAVMKATGMTPAAAHARSIEIARSPGGAPVAHVKGRAIPVSISHDGPVVVAVAIAAVVVPLAP